MMMHRKIYKFLSVGMLSVLMLSSCSLFVEDESWDLPSDAETITHSGDGYDAPKTVKEEDFEITYQYQSNTRCLTDEIQNYITNIESDVLGLSFIIYFDKNTPEGLIPRRGEVISCPMSDKFPDGIGAEVLSSGYEDGAYVVNAVATTQDKVFKVLKCDANINPAEAFMDENGDVQPIAAKVKRKKDGEGGGDEEYMTDVAFGKDSKGFYQEFTLPVRYSGEKGDMSLEIDDGESRVTNKLYVNLVMDGLSSVLTVNDEIDTDITAYVKGTMTLVDKTLKKGKILPKPIKKTFAVVTVIVNLSYELKLTGTIEATGVLRYVNHGILDLKTDMVSMLDMANPFSTMDRWGKLKDMVKDTEFKTNRWEFYTQITGTLELTFTVIGYVGVFTKSTGLQARPYLKGTLTATTPPISQKGRYDLTRNHAVKVGATAGIKVSVGIGGTFKEVITNIQEGYLDYATTASWLLKKLQKAISYGLDVYISSLPEEEQEEFKLSIAKYGIDMSGLALDELDKLLECIQAEIDKNKETGKESKANFKLSLELFSGELDGEYKTWYWYPKVSDKHTKLQRQAVTEGKTQTYQGYISWETKGILTETIGEKFYPCLDVYKQTETGEERLSVFNGYQDKKYTKLMEVSKDISQNYVYFNVTGLEGNATYLAYPCYSKTGGEEPTYYDKAIVLTTSLPAIVITDIKDFNCDYVDDGDMTYFDCTFSAYVTIKGAKAMSDYYLALYREKASTSLQRFERKKNLEDEKDKPYTFRVQIPESYGPLSLRVDIGGTLKPDENDGGAKVNTAGTPVTFNSVYFTIDPEEETITIKK